MSDLAKKVLVCALAVFALSAVAASSALAGLPEFVGQKANEKITYSSGEGTLETLSGNTVKCKKDSGSGTIVNSKEIAKNVITFEECKTVGKIINVSCANIKTAELTARLVYDNPSGTKKAAVLLKPTTGSKFAEFICGSGFTETKLVVSGTALGLIGTVNSKTKTNTVVAKLITGSKGMAEDTKYKDEGGAESTALTETEGTAIGGLGETFANEGSGLAGTETSTTTEAVEVKA